MNTPQHYTLGKALDRIAQLEQAVERLEQRNDELSENATKDTERLNWLEDQAKPESFEDAPSCNVWVLYGDPGANDIRLVIDAEMIRARLDDGTQP